VQNLPEQLYLWWLGEPSEPRYVGQLRWVPRAGKQCTGVALRYCPEWLQSGFALSEDLPLLSAEFLPLRPDAAVGAVDDARPDRWGERVIRFTIQPTRLSTLDYLFYAGDDRIGGLGVSLSATAYEPYWHGVLPQLKDIEQLHSLVRAVERGDRVEPELMHWVSPGATLGGAKPKALLNWQGRQWVMKFAQVDDPFDTGLVEHACMTLAAKAGIEVATTHAIALMPQSGLRHAVAVRRFDRLNGHRLHMVSAHVALHAAQQDMGYPELALLLRRVGVAEQVDAMSEQLFRRMVFNVLMDNTDDHEKNHALLWTPKGYTLAPAFDVLPAAQGLGYQSIRLGQEGARATLSNALSEHRAFGLCATKAEQLADEVMYVAKGWQNHFAALGVTASDLATLNHTIEKKQNL
jgi:serine/threonine-protein kinase HipA